MDSWTKMCFLQLSNSKNKHYNHSVFLTPQSDGESRWICWCKEIIRDCTSTNTHENNDMLGLPK